MFCAMCTRGSRLGQLGSVEKQLLNQSDVAGHITTIFNLHRAVFTKKVRARGQNSFFKGIKKYKNSLGSGKYTFKTYTFLYFFYVGPAPDLHSVYDAHF